MDNDMPSFFDRSVKPVINESSMNESFLNDELDHFEKLAQQNSIINSATSHKVGFTNNNSVLTFDSPPSDDAISLGDTIQLNALDIEDLDSSKPESVKLEFEEL
jgi:hypothetical protein